MRSHFTLMVAATLACQGAPSEGAPADGTTADATTATTTSVEPGTTQDAADSGTDTAAGSSESESTGTPDGEYPEDPAPLSPRACQADHVAAFPVTVAPQCAGRRSCIDPRARWWLHDTPFIPRGVYNGGFEWAQLQENCPAEARCQATTPTDVEDYVAMLADGGFNLIMERSRFTGELTAAINDNPDVYIAHLLWADMFADQSAHDAMVDEIEAAAADPDVVMWFGPDEVDLNGNWGMAAGIRRLLFGSDDALDDFLAEYAEEPPAFLPATEPAHDPDAMPYGAALAWDWGLDLGPNVYDVLMPITYPFQSAEHDAHEGQWGTWRISEWGGAAPMLPVLQMIGIPVMALSHPTPEQIEALGMSALVHGAGGAFHYNVIGDQPKHAGRDGWFAPDDADNWEAHRRVHARQDALIPVLFSDAEVETGAAPVEWQRFTLGGHRVIVLVNPTAQSGTIDVDTIVARQPGEYVRHYADCASLTSPILDVPGYGVTVLEVYPAG